MELNGNGKLTHDAVAIRFFRQLVILQDDFYIRHLAEKKILGPVLDVLLRTMPRDNLLCSACLDLFVLISKENIKDLIKHLVENYREKIMALAYIDTFREIITRYDHSQGYTTTVDPYFIESEDEMAGRRPTNHGARGMMEHLAVDPAEEEYWNTSDDEENVVRETLDHSATPSSNSGKPPREGTSGRPLVEYTSDDDSEDSLDAVMTSASAPPANEASKENKEPTTPGSTSGTATPPERVSEKRRREEDEDDALDKLVHHKRRNSNAASSNASINSATALRKKKNFGGGRDASPNGHGPKKIAITISSSIKTAAVKAGSEEEGK
jgi:protein phosphatase-4 regulatory subunit 3